MNRCTPYPTNCVAKNEKKLPWFILIDSKKPKTQGVEFCLRFYACPCDLNNFYAALNQSAVCFNVPMGIQNTAHFVT